MTRKMVSFVEKLYNQGITLDYINLGGGFGSRYPIEENGYSIEDFATAMGKESIRVPYSTTLIVEPGRYVVGDAMFGITRVLRKKDKGNKKILFTDLGVNNLVPLKSAHFDVYSNRLNDKIEISDIRGPMPFHADEIKRDTEIYAEEGELLIVANVGAYTTALSNNFCGQLRPPVISIQTNGDLKLVQRREIIDDMLLRNS